MEEGKQHYPVVIVGSGFGGSVMAYRLAEAGISVCLLERGKAYPPGSFPRSPYKMKQNFWDPSEGLYGLFNIWSFRGLGSVVSSGLGGGSLIYANVHIRKDEKWFVKEDISQGGYEYWPVTRDDLDPHYDRVEQMMQLQTYPFDRPPYNKTPKTIAFKAAAETLNLDWYLPNLAVTFGNEGDDPIPGEPIKETHPNLHNRTRYTCQLCGECDVGCNYGSKNTLDYTYLSEAKRLGAELKTLCEVRSFEPKDGGGYLIHYVQHDLSREGKPYPTSELPLMTISADQLVLSAGTMGSTYLLLKNRSALPHLSSKLGTRFCGNGDLLSIALRCCDNSSGQAVPRILDPSYGPVITSTIRIPGQEDGSEGRGYYVQDAGYPNFINWIAETFQTVPTFWKLRSLILRLLFSWISGKGPADSDLSAEISRFFGTTALSSGSLPLLGMGRDIPDGQMGLRNGKLDIDWRKLNSAAYFDRVRHTMRKIADVFGGTFEDNPTWYLNRLITVHPLGGCPMGRDETEGVVDSHGEVFNYPGLFVADGSVMPGPVGANPCLTIAALADRFANRVIDNYKSRTTKDYISPVENPSAPAVSPPSIGLQFTETMRGFFSTTVTDDYQQAAQQGQQDGSRFEFTLTVVSNHLEQMLTTPEHQANLFGSVTAPMLASEPLTVADGEFNLFIIDPEQANTRRMCYRMKMTAPDGKVYYLDGFKRIHDDSGIDVWSDTTTLYITVYDGDSASAPVLGKGILKILPADFIKQMTTLKITNTSDPAQCLRGLERFSRFFTKTLVDIYVLPQGKNR